MIVTRTGVLPSRPRRPRRARRAVRPLLAAACAVALLAVGLHPAGAAVAPPLQEPVTGNATWFDALGAPYGGCGLPQENLDSPNFIALNVYNTPKVYDVYPRPMPAGDPKIGLWDNGHNCGRWVEVTVSDFCTTVNSGQANEEFCPKGEWIPDAYNGAKLNMIVADSCGDSNAWCRDDPYHIDLAHAALNTFVKDGAPVGDMAPVHWNNRHVSWKFIPAPDYTGDISIGFLAGSKTGWTAVAVSHLANGIHGLDYWDARDATWVDATMDGDMGQAFIVKPTDEGGSTYSIRVRDVTDAYLNSGRVYTFELPKSCAVQCAEPYLAVPYTTSAVPPSAAAAGDRTCSVSVETVKSWAGGMQGQATVTPGDSKIYGWRVSFTLADGQTLGDAWNGTKSVDGNTVTVANPPWATTLAPGQSATFGFTVMGDATVPAMTCSAS